MNPRLGPNHFHLSHQEQFNVAVAEMTPSCNLVVPVFANSPHVPSCEPKKTFWSFLHIEVDAVAIWSIWNFSLWILPVLNVANTSPNSPTHLTEEWLENQYGRCSPDFAGEGLWRFWCFRRPWGRPGLGEMCWSWSWDGMPSSKMLEKHMDNSFLFYKENDFPTVNFTYVCQC